MKPIEPTDKERAAVGNGDWFEWIEYEAEANRDPNEYAGSGDRDPKYDLAKMLDPEYKTHLAIEELRRWFDDQ